MNQQPEHEEARQAPIFSNSRAASDEIIYLNQRRVEELDPVDIPVPDEEIIDPKKIEPIGNDGNNEGLSNVDGFETATDPEDIDDIDDIGAGDDEDTFHPVTPQTR